MGVGGLSIVMSSPTTSCTIASCAEVSPYMPTDSHTITHYITPHTTHQVVSLCHTITH